MSVIERRNLHRTCRMDQVELLAMCGISLSTERGDLVSIGTTATPRRSWPSYEYR